MVDLSDVSNYDRLCMAKAGIEMIADRPLLGIGPEMIPERYPIYRDPTAPRFWVPHLHDNLLQIAAERGLPALAAAVRGFRAAGGFEAARAGPAAASAAGLHLGALLARAVRVQLGRHRGPAAGAVRAHPAVLRRRPGGRGGRVAAPSASC